MLNEEINHRRDGKDHENLSLARVEQSLPQYSVTLYSAQGHVPSLLLINTHASPKAALLSCHDLQRVSSGTQRWSAAPSLIKGLFGKEQAEKWDSELFVCRATQLVEDAVESIRQAVI